MSTLEPPLRAAIIGMGGFAGRHHAALRSLEARGQVRLIATCDPQPTLFEAARREWDLEGRGVHIYTDYLQMLDAERNNLDFVCVPTPVPLHAPMHRACVERGLACYLEKPPTLFWGELEEMLQVESQARHQTQVGFNFIVEDARQGLKQRLLNGEFGRLKRAGFIGFWPRSEAYFQRAPWAGRLMMNGRLVLDSCIGNAMAHYVHNLLFWCGQDELLSWGRVQSVEAELYRGHEIESFDTCFARGVCGIGGQSVEILVAATHAGVGTSWHWEWLECEDATISYPTGEGHYEIHWRDGRTESGQTKRGTLLEENLGVYARYLRGEASRPLTRLEDARPFVHFNNLLFIAANRISSVDEAFLQRATLSNGVWVAIDGIEEAMNEFAQDGQLPGERDLAWGRRGGRAQAEEVTRLIAVVEAEAQAARQDAL